MDEEDGYGYYDSVEARTEKGRVFIVFNKFHHYPQYLVTFNYGTEPYDPKPQNPEGVGVRE